MAAVPGYNGKLLRVNLTDQKVTTEELDERFCRHYIGGAGFVIHYLWKEVPANVDALSPDNKLIFALGPVTGLQLPGAARHCVGAKSPITGGIAKAETGGHWMAQLKRAGFDAIIVEGKAAKPVYLWVHDGEAEIKDASKLWGMETKDTESAIRAELGDDHVQTALIGSAGENMVLYACIMHGLHDAAARGGLGAVMGSKNLKAVAVRGTKAAPEVADPEKVKEIRQFLIANPAPIAKFLSAFGTGGPDTIPFEASGNLPVRNFRDGVFPGINDIHAGIMKDTMDFRMEGCFACPIRCKKMVGFKEPYVCEQEYGGPEYETLAALGSNCGLTDIKAMVKANERCSAYALDTISTGNVIAFAMECYERGLLTQKDTDGIDMKFGNGEAVLQSIELIAQRKGFGDFMAQGVARMSQKLGKETEEFAIHVKGLEAAMHEPRFKPGLGYGFMLNPQGADHCWGMHDSALENPAAMKQFEPFGYFDPVGPRDQGPRKVALVKLSQSNSAIGDSLSVCSFVPYSWDLKAKVLSAVTGWNVGLAELIQTAERIITMARLFNIRHGLSAKDDKLPGRFFVPKTDGVLSTPDKALVKEDYEEGRKFYYAIMGWDEEGVPLPGKVAELEIV
jgi:aldehyde:ferredoxin oxidoreductase